MSKLTDKFNNWLNKYIEKLLNKVLDFIDIPFVEDPLNNENSDSTTTDPQQTQPEQTPAQTTPSQPEKPDDEVSYKDLDWCYGGFKGNKATLTSARIKDLNVTSKGLSYTWEKGSCTDLDKNCTHNNACCTCALFCKVNGKWVGGKFDHISTDRTTRGFENIDGAYNGWKKSSITSATAYAFVILDDGAKKRTNIIVQENK